MRIFLGAAVLYLFLLEDVQGGSKSSLERFGDIGQHLVPATAFCVSLSKGDKEGVIQLLKSSAVTMAVVYGIKYSTCCTRPYGGCYSFPSRHTSGAFMGTAYLDKRYGFVYSFPRFIISSVVGYSRTQAHKHHLRDVVVGAFIAYISAWTLTTPYQRQLIRISPLYDRDCCGLFLTKAF